jgi:hypothetical protein
MTIRLTWSSPQFPMIVGPGYWLLINMQTRDCWPSGLHVVLVIVRSYVTVFPVGQEVYMSVFASKPEDQQLRLVGPLVQVCFFSRTGAGLKPRGSAWSGVP